MQKLTLKYKTGITLTKSRDIDILDFRGILFYSTKWLNKIPRKFNLPKGTYYFSHSHFKLGSPIEYKLELPEKEREKKLSKYKIEFAPNPHKATIFYNQKKIVFDPSFKKRALHELIYILYHEIGHHFYASEHKADLFAASEMLKRGYNKVQVARAQFFTLSSKQIERKQFVVNNIDSQL